MGGAVEEGAVVGGNKTFFWFRQITELFRKPPETRRNQLGRVVHAILRGDQLVRIFHKNHTRIMNIFFILTSNLRVNCLTVLIVPAL